MTRPRSIELLVDDQVRRWVMRPGEQREKARGSVIAMSRLPGSRGDEVARRLSTVLHYDLFDREIIQEIARGVHMSERVVSDLDEKNRSPVSDWLVSFAQEFHLSTYEYLHRLRMVVRAIAGSGAAVIVGRGANVILGPSEALRVLVVAPREMRVATVAEQAGVSRADANRKIQAEEAERRAFLQKHFHTELGNPENFDLVVNTHVLGVEGAVETIKAALPTLATRSDAA